MIELVLAIIKDTLLVKKLYSLIYQDINLDLMASYILTQKKKKSIKTIKVRVQIATFSIIIGLVTLDLLKQL